MLTDNSITLYDLQDATGYSIYHLSPVINGKRKCSLQFALLLKQALLKKKLPKDDVEIAIAELCVSPKKRP